MLASLKTYAPILAFLFVVTNIFIGIFLVWIAERSRIAIILKECTGIVAPIISVVALLFSLYSAFLASEVSSSRESARAAVAREGDKLHLLLVVSSALGNAGRTLNAIVHDYGAVATTEGWYSTEQATGRRALDRMLNEALFGDIRTADAGVQRILVDAVTAVSDAHRARLLAALSPNSHAKWVVTYVFMLMTQMALVLVHLGKPRAAIASTTLFACAAALSMVAILGRMDPFSGLNPISLAPIQSVFENGA